MHTALPCCGHAGYRALADQLPFELRQRGKEGEEHSPLRLGRVDAGAQAGEDFQSYAALAELLGKADEIDEASAETVELPRDQDITLATGPNSTLEAAP